MRGWDTGYENSYENKPQINADERRFARRIGASAAWFAVFEELIIASGKSEEEARERAYAVVPQNKRAGVYVFRHGRK